MLELRIGELPPPLHAVYMAISIGCPEGSVIFIWTLSGTELVVNENQVMGESDPVHKTFAPVEEEVL
jgi:hypothetical protein